jgi:hypothetical protein
MNNQIYFESLKIARDAADFSNYLISTYGEVKVIKYGNNDKNFERNKYHDFIYFCFTKSCRSLYASIELAEKNFREDSLMVLRTVYENYLHISHVLKNPQKIQEYVDQPVGLFAGKYIYKIDEHGKKHYNIVVDRKTKKEYKHATSNFTRAKLSINNYDIKVHQYIYNYLSEHIHPNMMASGNYRNNNSENYLVEPCNLHLEVVFLILYLCFILLDVMNYYHTRDSIWNVEDLSIPEITEFIAVRRELMNKIYEVLEISEFDKNLDKLIIDRITNAS